jgi:hypothetical protein
MSDWNGTILGPPHVRTLQCSIIAMITIRIGHAELDRPQGLVLQLFSHRRTHTQLTSVIERPRESHLQCQDPLRPQLPRSSS